MASKFNYCLTKKAKFDLDEIVSYFAIDLVNHQSASDFISNILNNIYQIRIFPESGFLVQNEFLQVDNIRKILVDSYIMYYKVNMEEKKIYILRIVYGKRNMDEILKNLNV